MFQFYKVALIKRVSCICPLHIPDKKISICENEIWPQIRQPDRTGDVNNQPPLLHAPPATREEDLQLLAVAAIFFFEKKTRFYVNSFRFNRASFGKIIG